MEAWDIYDTMSQTLMCVDDFVIKNQSPLLVWYYTKSLMNNMLSRDR